MIACLSPLDDYLDENMSTLNYASRAQNISNLPIINQDPRLKIIQDQKKTIERLQLELKRANDQIKFLTNQMQNSQNVTPPLQLTSRNMTNQELSPNNMNNHDKGFTINNNYNSNLIAIINGDKDTTATAAI